MMKACEMAHKSDFNNPTGCVVVYKGKIIAKGCNQKKTHPLQVIYDKERPDVEEGCLNVHSLHAESDALFRIMNDTNIKWSKVEVYIYRPLKSKPFGLARPCPSCMKLIKDLGIKKIHYTSDDNSYITEEWV